MSLPTQQELQNLSIESGFLQNPLEKVLRIVSILKQIFVHPFLQDKLVLKGGTALNIFYLDLPRLSVDIDLNYTGSLDREEMLVDKDHIRSIIGDLFSSDYHVTVGRDEFALMQHEFQYRNLANTDDKLRIEINYLHRLPLDKVNVMDFRRFDIQGSFPVLSLEEILASKIITLLSRYAPRDLFDIYQVSTSGLNPDRNRTRALVIYYGLVSRIGLFELLDSNLDSITDYEIRRHLHPLLVKGRYPDREVMVRTVENSLARFLTLKEDERKAIEGFFNTGELDFHVVFPQNELRKKVTMSPAFQWKAQNLRRFLKGSKRG